MSQTCPAIALRGIHGELVSAGICAGLAIMMTKRSKLASFFAGLIASGVLVLGTWRLLAVLLPRLEVSLFVRLLVCYLLPLSLAAMVLVILRRTWLASRIDVFRYLTRGYLALAALLLVYLVVGVMSSTTQEPVDEFGWVLDDPRYDPNDISTGDELKERYFGRLPRDIDRLRITSVYPRNDPNSQEVYFEYSSPHLYEELDQQLEFRTVNNAIFRRTHRCLGIAMIYFYRGDELCRLRWNYAHGNFFYPGLLTQDSKEDLCKWFGNRGFTRFSEWKE